MSSQDKAVPGDGDYPVPVPVHHGKPMKFTGGRINWTGPPGHGATINKFWFLCASCDTVCEITYAEAD